MGGKCKSLTGTLTIYKVYPVHVFMGALRFTNPPHDRRKPELAF